MKHIQKYILFSLLLLIVVGCKHNKAFGDRPISDCPQSQVSENRNSDFMELYYGMERDVKGYTFRDSVLDNTCGLIGYNYSDTIFQNIDNYKARLSLGIYLDKEYPNKIIQSRIEEAIDTTLCNDFGYFDDLLLKDLKNKTHPSDSIGVLFKFWDKTFNRIVASLSNEHPSSEYGVTLEARVCVLAHKIYEDSVWVTYIIESTVDYHGSCGCTSVAEYISYNKSNGSILTIQDIKGQYQDIDFAKLLWLEYEKAAAERDTTPNLYFSSKSLLDKADGVAYTNCGLLLYFKPYNIGCGAEGQYNLLIQL